MHFILRLCSYFLGNVVGLLTASYWIPAFHVDTEPSHIAAVAALLVAANLTVKPVLKLLLAPIILLTLGLFTFIINAAILYGIDFLSPYLTIEGMRALLWGTVIVSAANMIAGWGANRVTAE